MKLSLVDLAQPLDSVIPLGEELICNDVPVGITHIAVTEVLVDVITKLTASYEANDLVVTTDAFKAK